MSTKSISKTGWYAGNCKDCKRINHPYMLTFELWKKVCDNRKDILCLYCVENRLGRKLTSEDFLPNVPINNGCFGFFSYLWVKRVYQNAFRGET
jgi:hypothetical protein